MTYNMIWDEFGSCEYQSKTIYGLWISCSDELKDVGHFLSFKKMLKMTDWWLLTNI